MPGEMSERRTLTRRNFLQLSALTLGGLALRPLGGDWAGLRALTKAANLDEFPQAERLGRVFSSGTKVYARPDDASPVVKELGEDTIVAWQRELVGSRPMWFNQRFIETPEGFIYSPNLQPVKNQPNQPLTSLPAADGMWAEVSVPYVDLTLANPPARSPWLGFTPRPRLYYSQIMWVDQIKVEDGGQVWYRAAERYGTFGDIFWVAAEALRPLAAEEFTPIHPEAEEKRVTVNLVDQSLSCYEGSREVYFCRVSTGGKFDSSGNASSKWATPVGTHSIWRKMVSVHMTGGTTGGGYDLPGIGWTTLFSGKGMAIHSTFWHNGYGVPLSHGCVNAAPDDAKWVFRWTMPAAPPESGDITISGQGSTKVEVFER